MNIKKLMTSLLSVALTACSLTSMMTAAAAVPETSEYLYTSDENITDNRLSENMDRYGYIVESYIQQNADGTTSRISPDSEGNVHVDFYDSKNEFDYGIILDSELPKFGAFYSGAEYNFVLYGQNNPSESDSTEVYRVVKYSKNWEKLGSKSFYGCNTTEPFAAGSARMTESGGTLFIHTCHKMYTSDDGLNHQANVQLYVDEDTMECTYSYYDVMNVKQRGYVSHSFDQYIKAENGYVYTADHGDAYPRSVAVCKKSSSGKMLGYIDALPIEYGDVGNNTTGVSLGGFELSEENIITVGNTMDQSDTSAVSLETANRYIFVNITDKELGSTKTIPLSDVYNRYTFSVPKLVKLGNDKFVVMWNEYVSGKFDQMRSALIDGSGNILKESATSKAQLSKCDPVVMNGEIVWYTSNGSSSDMYIMDSALNIVSSVEEEPSETPSTQESTEEPSESTTTQKPTEETTQATTERYVVNSYSHVETVPFKLLEGEFFTDSTDVYSFDYNDGSFDLDNIYVRYIRDRAEYPYVYGYITYEYNDGSTETEPISGNKGVEDYKIPLSEFNNVELEYNSPAEAFDNFSGSGNVRKGNISFTASKLGDHYSPGYYFYGTIEGSFIAEIEKPIETVTSSSVVTSSSTTEASVVTFTSMIQITTDLHTSSVIGTSESIYINLNHASVTCKSEHYYDCDDYNEFDLSDVYVDLSFDYGVAVYYTIKHPDGSISSMPGGSIYHYNELIPLSELEYSMEYESPHDVYMSLGKGKHYIDVSGYIPDSVILDHANDYSGDLWTCLKYGYYNNVFNFRGTIPVIIYEHAPEPVVTSVVTVTSVSETTANETTTTDYIVTSQSVITMTMETTMTSISGFKVSYVYDTYPNDGREVLSVSVVTDVHEYSYYDSFDPYSIMLKVEYRQRISGGYTVYYIGLYETIGPEYVPPKYSTYTEVIPLSHAKDIEFEYSSPAEAYSHIGGSGNVDFSCNIPAAKGGSSDYDTWYYFEGSFYVRISAVTTPSVTTGNHGFDVDVYADLQRYLSSDKEFHTDGIKIYNSYYGDDVTDQVKIYFSNTPREVYDGKKSDYVVTIEVYYDGSRYYCDIPVKIVPTGDVYGNGTVDIYDAAYIAKYTVGKKAMDDFTLRAADYNGDGIVDIFDAVAIAKYTVSLDY